MTENATIAVRSPKELSDSLAVAAVTSKIIGTMVSDHQLSMNLTNYKKE